MSRVLKNAINQVTCKYNSITHKGIDLVKQWSSLSEIMAHSEGLVWWIQTGKKNNLFAVGNATYGNAVKIRHNNGYYTLYAHLDRVDVSLNQTVKKGQVIGYMGNTGVSKGGHLHFEVRNTSDTRIDPTPYINADLPNDSTNRITYQTYDNQKKIWLPNVSTNTNDYAGNFGNAVGGLYIDNLEYRVYDNKKRCWLPWVKGRSDYAGNLGNSIGGLQVKNATYRVHIKGGNWLDWVNKVDNTPNGYAGIFGRDIDAIQIKG